MNSFTEDPLDDMDIQHIRLSDGNEIIAYINSIDGAMIVMERPMILNLAMQANGNDTYFFTKFMPFAKSSLVKLNSRNVVSATEVRNDIKERYIHAALKSDEKVEQTKTDAEMEKATEEEIDLNYAIPPSKKLH